MLRVVLESRPNLRALNMPKLTLRNRSMIGCQGDVEKVQQLHVGMGGVRVVHSVTMIFPSSVFAERTTIYVCG